MNIRIIAACLSHGFPSTGYENIPSKPHASYIVEKWPRKGLSGYCLEQERGLEAMGATMDLLHACLPPCQSLLIVLGFGSGPTFQ